MNKQPEGFLLIKKPALVKSFHNIYHIRSFVGKRYRVGHSGILDGFASGLLILALGRAATRHMQLFIELDKRYNARAQFGVLTDTLDHTGRTIFNKTVSVDEQQCAWALKQLGDSYLQTPPIYSALQYKGERLWLLARYTDISAPELQEIMQKKRRKVFLHMLDMASFNFPYFSVQAHVSHGTYIRTLMNDIAQMVGTHATTISLERTHIGPFSIDRALELSQLRSLEDVEKNIIPVDRMLKEIKEYGDKN